MHERTHLILIGSAECQTLDAVLHHSPIKFNFHDAWSLFFFPLELIVCKRFFIFPPALQMHIKSIIIIIRESKLDVLRQSWECIIIRLPKALQLLYLVYLCTLKACFQTHCLQTCPSKTEVLVRVVVSRHITELRDAGNLHIKAHFRDWLKWKLGWHQ